jgi:AIPR protein
MNINASIIDQQVRKLAEECAKQLADELGINQEEKQRTTAFVLLTAKTVMDLVTDKAFECLTEGGDDFGVDAIHISDVQDDEFVVTIFQGKYKRDLEVTSNFPENGVTKVIQAVRMLFDPNATLNVNDLLKPRLEEIRSFIRDGNLPQVRVVLCNNGLKWTATAQNLIDQAAFGKQVSWEHVNCDTLVGLMQSVKPVDDTLHLSGKAMVEEYDFRRVLVGRISVTEIAALFTRHDERLLERNIRRYLGLQGNRVNEAISNTLGTAVEGPNFYFYNNGITMVCRRFSHNALQQGDFQVKVEGLQVINGGQTCVTIQRALSSALGGQTNVEKSFVLVRIYELPSEDEDLVRSITYATNSQNPVDLRDLRSNDLTQRQLENAIGLLGYHYRRHRSEASFQATDVTTATAAEAVLSVWRNRPHQAKYQSREHFGKLYEVIFSPSLNGAQVVIATLHFRVAENKRKRPPAGAPTFLPYSGCFVAMLMGRYLLADLGAQLDGLTHLKFAQAKQLVEQRGEAYFQKAVTDVEAALKKLYGQQEVSLQRLAATFRRCDLIQELNEQPALPVVQLTN